MNQPIDMSARLRAMFWPDRLSALVCVMWFGLLVLAAWWPKVPHWPVRITVALLVASVLLRLWKINPRMLLSPLPLLSAGAVMFFSMLPAAYIAFSSSLEIRAAIFQDDDTRYLDVMRYFNDIGELIVLQFALSLLAIAAAIRPQNELTINELTEAKLRVAGQIAVSILILSALFLGLRWLMPAFAAWTKSGLGAEILTYISPLTSFCVAVLACVATQVPAWRLRALAGGSLGVAALFSLFSAKTPVFIGFGSILLYVVLGSRRNIRLWQAAAFGAVGLTIAILALAELRSGSVFGVLGGEGQPRPPSLASIVVQKLVVRQIDTAGCFSNVLEEHLTHPPRSSMAYFLAGIVPRAFWSEKPALSLGDQYAIRYCKMTAGAVYGADSVHSASITLLGEQVVEAGLRGLILSQASLIALFLITTLLMARSSVVGHISMAATLPWLIDFDQSLTLYFANAAKMFLCIGLATAFLWFFLREDAGTGHSRLVSR